MSTNIPDEIERKHTRCPNSKNVVTAYKAAYAELSIEYRKLAERMINEVPSNWMDPLLSGPDSVLPLATAGKWGCPDIERLLKAVRERIKQAASANTDEGEGR